MQQDSSRTISKGTRAPNRASPKSLDHASAPSPALANRARAPYKPPIGILPAELARQARHPASQPCQAHFPATKLPVSLLASPPALRTPAHLTHSPVLIRACEPLSRTLLLLLLWCRLLLPFHFSRQARRGCMHACMQVDLPPPPPAGLRGQHHVARGRCWGREMAERSLSVLCGEERVERYAHGGEGESLFCFTL